MKQKDQFNEAITELTKGMSFNTACQVEKILGYYIGTKNSPAPFGGRNNKITELNNWLDNPNVPHNLALIANAGRGKSALLANWVINLINKRNDFYIIYFPITSRYDTNLESVVFNAIAGRISLLFNENVNTFNPLDAQNARELFMAYLNRDYPNNKKILIILDGLDEAAGWECGTNLLPSNSNDHLKIIVAARPLAGDRGSRDWLSRLGWDSYGCANSMALNLLEIQEVKDVLIKMGNPIANLAIDYDINEKLHELSEGDPLLLRLYVESLQESKKEIASLTPVDLLDLKPGFGSYFDRWFNDQRKIWIEQFKSKIISVNELDTDRRVKAFFSILAFAKSPLSLDDIYGIGNNKFKDRDEIRNIVKYTNRFIVGDGINNGFVFSHSKLGYYFADQLGKIEKRAYKQLFLDYCKNIFISLKENKIRIEDVSHYVIKNYRIHLEENQAEQKYFYSLMCKEWLHAWEDIEGTPSGFLTDVNVAWLKAVNEGPRGIDKQIFAALCFSSVISRSINIPVNLLYVFVKNKVISPQLAYIFAEKDLNEFNKINKLINISTFFSETEQKDKVIHEALKLSRKLKDNDKKIQVISKILMKLSLVDRKRILEETLVFLKGIEDKKLYVKGLSEIIQFIPKDRKRERINEIFELLSHIEDKLFKVCILAKISKYLPDKEKKEVLFKAEYLVNGIEDKKTYVQAYLKIIELLPTNKRENISLELLRKTKLVKELYTRIDIVAKLVPFLPDRNKISVLKESLKLVVRINDNYFRLDALVKLVNLIPESERGSLTFDLYKDICKLGDDKYKAQLLTSVANFFPEEERQNILNKAFELAGRISDGYFLINVLLICTNFLPEEKKNNNLYKALSLIDRVKDRCDQILTLIKISEKLSQKDMMNYLHNALVLSRNYGDDYFRVMAQLRIAQNFPENEKKPLLDEILITARKIEDWMYKVQGMTEVARLFPEQAKHNILHEALEMSEKIGNDFFQITTKIRIAEQLPKNNRNQILQKLLKKAREVRDPYFEVNCLIEISKRLPKIEQTNVLQEALIIIQEMNKHILPEVVNITSGLYINIYKINSLIEIASQMPDREKEKILYEIFIISESLRENDYIYFLITYMIYPLFHKNKMLDYIDFQYMHENFIKYLNLRDIDWEFSSLWGEMCTHLELQKSSEIEKILRSSNILGRERTLNTIGVFIPQFCAMNEPDLIDKIVKGIVEIGDMWP